ncbi:hypothetical protein, partial [Alkalibacillus haloalkaliphilus]|uniref:hypothetical protein n=1 Tax=Alkalibacillus haloalkaliphilus TaxID=94136 RepID=UPI002936B2D7
HEGKSEVLAWVRFEGAQETPKGKKSNDMRERMRDAIRMRSQSSDIAAKMIWDDTGLEASLEAAPSGGTLR